MDDPEGSYAPESPDLSAFHQDEPEQQPPGESSSAQFKHGPDAMVDDEPGQKVKPVRAKSKRQSEKAPVTGEAKEKMEIRTKFPVARIKRIMQADEDVGKVSQVTPVAMSKALELFMISLVSKAVDEAEYLAYRRVTTRHLKQAARNEEQYDFLEDIISKIPDTPTPREKSEDVTEGEGSKRKKSSGGGGRKKKRDAEEL